MQYVRAFLLGTAFAAPSFLFAGAVGTLTSFSNGTVADADEVNGNFAAIVTAVDDNDARIGSAEAQVATNTANITSVSGSVSSNDADIASLTADVSANDARLDNLSFSGSDLDLSNGTVRWDFWDLDLNGPSRTTLTVEEAICRTRHGIWDGTACNSPIIYSQNSHTRLESQNDALTACPTGYTNADCDTAMMLLKEWRLNSNSETPGGQLWCAGTMDGNLNGETGKRGMPGYWYSAGADAPYVCETGEALVVDQCAPTENGCVGRASYHRPHFYCRPEGISAEWACISTATP
jgi:hypothetical protein